MTYIESLIWKEYLTDFNNVKASFQKESFYTFVYNNLNKSENMKKDYLESSKETEDFLVILSKSNDNLWKANDDLWNLYMEK